MRALLKIPDRRKTYYKMMNATECHKRLQYHDGLIIDPKEFNNDPYASCVKGGIYFTTKECLHKFFGYGKIIRPVTIPSDAKVILDPTGDKYRADRLFFLPKKDIAFYFDNLFNKKIFPERGDWSLATHCPNRFDVWFDKATFPKEDYWCLAAYCPNRFDVWFDKETFPKKCYWRLAEYCSDRFDEWFDKTILPKDQYWSLAKYCSKHFDKWFDKKTFPTKDYWYLRSYCAKYEHVWDK